MLENVVRFDSAPKLRVQYIVYHLSILDLKVDVFALADGLECWW